MTRFSPEEHGLMSRNLFDGPLSKRPWYFQMTQSPETWRRGTSSWPEAAWSWCRSAAPSARWSGARPPGGRRTWTSWWRSCAAASRCRTAAASPPHTPLQALLTFLVKITIFERMLKHALFGHPLLSFCIASPASSASPVSKSSSQWKLSLTSSCGLLAPRRARSKLHRSGKVSFLCLFLATKHKQ